MSASSAGGDKQEALRLQLQKDESTCAHPGPRHESGHFLDPPAPYQLEQDCPSTSTDHERSKVIVILSPCVWGFETNR